MLARDQVVRLVHLSWNTVRSTVDAAVAYGRACEKYQGVWFIGIGEISWKKRHVHCIQVYDLESKRPLWTGAHRDEDLLRRFFE
jgi:transposase